MLIVAFSISVNSSTEILQDKQVNELAQELAVHLGLKVRKPYVSTKVSKCLDLVDIWTLSVFLVAIVRWGTVHM